MVFGGRRMMATSTVAKGKSNGRKKLDATKSKDKTDYLASYSENLHHHPHPQHGIFSEDPEFTLWLEEPDPIVIDFEDEGHSKSVPYGFRVPSKSFGEQGNTRNVHHLKHLPAPWPGRRAWSEGSLALGGKARFSSVTGCPCETVQGIHSHRSCHDKMDLAIPETCCFTCGSDWALEHTAWACFECGGYGLARPCGKCNGKCGERWSRDLKVTHITGGATWAGKCSLEKENNAVTVPDLANNNNTSTQTQQTSVPLLRA